MNAYAPMSTADDELWLFVELPDGIGVGRLGYDHDSDVIGVFPIDAFTVHDIMPIHRYSLHQWSGVRWATTTDVDTYDGPFVVVVG
ncbi:hypothetical protein EV191_11288 [Tamaricihabitans halophyticus]|uniref:Uncharacterized protein n=1 Tax=Tamaricihabitans halophyticus TaxID=1262583 RepID=A0A4R2QE07_9PSEU|nr:hypothetical protein [Tamaricihabitans halophyticus]TCP47292.1 hypothetical protein EV191_11288 [Tamaricihabitans halophyticus]